MNPTQRENKKLRAALRPFARLYEKSVKQWGCWCEPMRFYYSESQMKTAFRAYSGKKKQR